MRFCFIAVLIAFILSSMSNAVAMEVINKQLLKIGVEREHETVTVENIDVLALEHIKKKNSDIGIENLKLSKKFCDAPFHKTHSQGICSAFFQQYYKDLLVWSSLISATNINGKFVHETMKYFSNISSSVKPKITEKEAIKIIQNISGTEKEPNYTELVIFPKELDDKTQYYLTWWIEMPFTERGEAITAFVDAITKEVVYKFDRVRFQHFQGQVQGEVFPEHPAQNKILVPFAHNTLKVNNQSMVTDDKGLFPVPASANAKIEASLTGPYVSVTNSAGNSSHYSGTNDQINWKNHDQSYEQQESNLFFHVNRIHDFFTKGDPFDVPLNYPVNALINFMPPPDWLNCTAQAVCNKSNLRSARNFMIAFSKPGVCAPTSLYSDLIYHEYTHGVVCHVYTYALDPYEGETGAMNEGLADYFAASFTNDPCMFDGLRNIKCSRNLAEQRKYPRDYTPIQAHAASRPFSSALWSLRRGLLEELVDDLVIRTMKLEPQSFAEFIKAMLIIDDDNGNLNDGTPHQKTICRIFYDEHGLYSPQCAEYTIQPMAVITSPYLFDDNIFDPNTMIKITGTATGGDHKLKSYRIETIGSQQTSWVKLHEGTKEVIEGELATIDTSSFKPGEYTLKLAVVDMMGSQNEWTSYFSIKFPTHTGWPRGIDEHFPYPAVVADINHDGKKEIIANNDKCKIYVWDHEGNSLPGWPITSCTSTPIALADLNADGNLEIVVGSSYGAVAIYTYLGERFSGWQSASSFPKVNKYATSLLSALAVADLDDKGGYEIIVPVNATESSSSAVYVFSEDGKIANGWPVSIPIPQSVIHDLVYNTPTLSSPAVGDIDNDGDDEIIVSSLGRYGETYAFHHDGRPVSGWPQKTNVFQVTYPSVFAMDKYLSSPVLADVDSDGYLEIFISSPYTDGKLHGWRYDGKDIKNWPLNITPQGSPPRTYISSPAIGNIEKTYENRHPTIFTNISHVSLGVNDLGNVDFYCVGDTVRNVPIIGDVDGDDLNDIIVTTANNRVHAFNNGGCNEVNGFPKTFSNSVPSFVTLNDIDDDGLLETVITTIKSNTIKNGGGVYVFDLAGKYAPENMQWPSFRSNIRNTGLFFWDEPCYKYLKKFKLFKDDPKMFQTFFGDEMNYVQELIDALRLFATKRCCENYALMSELMFEKPVAYEQKIFEVGADPCCVEFSDFFDKFENAAKTGKISLNPKYIIQALTELGKLKGEICVSPKKFPRVN